MSTNEEARNKPGVRKGYLVALLGVLVLLGCWVGYAYFSTRTPSLSTPSVRQLVIGAGQEAYRDVLLRRLGPEHTGMTLDAMFRYNGVRPTYNDWDQYRGEHDGITAALKEIDETIGSLDLALERTRILREDPEAGRVEFEAVLNNRGGGEMDIVGVVQYTEDQQVYAEVNIQEIRS